ncbi:MAG: hypothetical protein JWM11_1340 [Planctomycetaceae bacterium]|nr:hypothetical protein [Planctomycetaceae bacterium]
MLSSSHSAWRKRRPGTIGLRGFELSASEKRIILGINAAYHESSAAIIVGDTVVHAVEEERLSRVKHAKPALVSNPDELPWRAIRSCLDAADLESLSDCHAISYSLLPNRRQATVGRDPYPIDPILSFGTLNGEREFERRVRHVPKLLAESAGNDDVANRVHFVAHHRAHAASAFFCSPFDHAALLVVDGIGEDSTAWLGCGTSAGIQTIEEIPYPQSIGLLWERIAVYLGFTEYDACKVMGLSAYGDPDRFETEFDRLFQINSQTSATHRASSPPFFIDPLLARFRSGDVRGLETLFGPRRLPSESVEQARFADVAAGLQKRTEEAVLALCWQLAITTGEMNLAYSGGVALNCVANARIERDGPFDNIYVIAAAHDAGTAIGAAAETAGSEVWQKKCGLGSKISPFLGPEYTADEIDRTLQTFGYEYEKSSDCVEQAVTLLMEGHIIGWFQGRLEFGPRALGGRSLLVDPRNTNLRERLNQRVKHRERFRPFGASVLEEQAAEWFEFPRGRDGAMHSRDLMLLAYRVNPEKVELIPAVVHRDGTCRIQTVNREANPLFHRLLNRFFERTGVPVLLNTSFNDQEPLVATPEDALLTFARTDIDDLFLQNRHVSRDQHQKAFLTVQDFQ